MKTTLDIPDTMYRRIQARAALEDSSVRGITLVLYAKWLDETPESVPLAQTPRKDRKAPSWFGSVKVDSTLPHDMTSIRESIARHAGG